MSKNHAKYTCNHLGIKVNENEERATVSSRGHAATAVL